MGAKLEHVLTNYYKADMILYVKSHPDDFDELVSLAISDNKVYSWRAAWLLWSCMDENDPRIQKYLKDIFNALASAPDNRLRELLIILNKMQLDEDAKGKLFDFCVEIWKQTTKQASLRYKAFLILVKTVKDYPELSTEIEFLTEPEYMDPLSDTVKKSISKLMGDLRK